MRINSLRRKFLLSAAVLLPTVPVRAESELPVVEVWKSPSCGCCRLWIKHLENSGFTVKAFDQGNAAVRRRLGMPNRYGSCHTARVDGYVVEGHVSAKDILRMLEEKPDAIGIAVPNMPIGSPGMDGPAYGYRRDPYDVLLVNKDGNAKVFSSYR